SSESGIGVYGLGNHYASGCVGVGIGVRGMAGGGAITPRGYGVSGIVKGSTGAGVFGKNLPANGTIDSNFETVFSGAYAGYFDGNAVVTGTLTATVTPPSDSRLKKNVLDLEYQSTLTKLMQLRPVEYNMQQVLFDVDSTDENGNTVTYQVQRYDESTQFFQKTHYGLIAQEVKEIYPDLVYEGSDGYLGIDYTSLVPMLLKVVQQQQAEIENLKSERSNAPARTDNSVSRNAALFQNAPNPFNESSEIAFYLPESVKTAMLCVYDMNGKQLSQTVIKERGDAKFVVNGKSYSAGMYLYSLIADSQVVDTKRMILTK
ncbi:MAG: tail fiber domain-containing protein, partial [Prevotellaceae bacterium]|nr:tail fiber domain-containing protein [Prevotellaceae bacterium]